MRSNARPSSILDCFSEPVYGAGDWPELPKKEVPQKWLPAFSDEDKELIKGERALLPARPETAKSGRDHSCPVPLFVSSQDLPTSTLPIYTAPQSAKRHPKMAATRPAKATLLTQLGQTALTTLPSSLMAGLGRIVSADTTPWLISTPGAVREHLRFVHERWPSPKLYVSEFGW